MLILGIVLIVVGVVEYVVVSLVTRRQAAAAGIGEEAPRPPAMTSLKRTALIEVGLGVVLLVIGLLS